MYLDMQATTPLDPRVVDAMLPFMTGQVGYACVRRCCKLLHTSTHHFCDRCQLRTSTVLSAQHQYNIHACMRFGKFNAFSTLACLQFGNPHSRTHYYGWESEEAMETARAEVSHTPVPSAPCCLEQAAGAIVWHSPSALRAASPCLPAHLSM